MDERNIRQSGDQNRLEGLGDKVKGKAKDAFGGLTDDNSMQAEGKLDKLKGKAKDVLGKGQQKIADESERNRTRNDGL
jgi:uncharacterized protein YjbJ (UPF0337 family)